MTFEDLVDSASVVSFDVFDTALYRSVVNPDDVNLAADEMSTENIERLLCSSNKPILSMYHEARVKDKKVVFITDTDYPARMITELLESNGYEGKVYASSEYGKSKENGLYAEVAWDLAIMPKEIVHIGDNYQSDLIAAQKQGVRSILIPRLQANIKEEYRKVKDNHALFALSHFKALSLVDKQEYWYNIGYNVLGPILVAFSWWIDYHAKKDCVDRLYFLSSEGQIIKMVYDMVAKNPLPTRYLYGSRRAWAVPAVQLKNPSPLDCELMQRIQHQWLDGDNHPDEPWQSIIDREKEKVREYLKIENVFDGLCGFVDIGYAGTMQLALEKYGATRQWYYLATNHGARALEHFNPHYKSYLCHNGYPIDYWIMMGQGVPVIESLLAATHGTVIGYNNGVPITYEYPIPDVQRGILASIRLGVFSFADKNKNMPTVSELPPVIVSQKLYDLIINPSSYDAQQMSKLVWYHAMGEGKKKLAYRRLSKLEYYKWYLSLKIKGE